MEQQATLTYKQGELLLEVPADLFIPPNPLKVSLEEFSGPLDILVHLIRKNKLAIEQVDVTEIALQYEEYLQLMKQFNLQLASDYLVMAAILAEIKSSSLLPSTEEEEDDPHQNMGAMLIRRLKEYAIMRDLAAKIAELPRLGRDFWTLRLKYQGPVTQTQRQITPQQLGRAMKSVMARQKVRRNYELQQETLSTEDRMLDILSKLRSAKILKSVNGFISFKSFLVATEGKPGVAVTLISLLQLIKEMLVEVAQKEHYQDILIRLKHPNKPNEEQS